MKMIYDEQSGLCEVASRDVLAGTFFKFQPAQHDWHILLLHDHKAQKFDHVSRHGLNRSSAAGLVWCRPVDVPSQLVGVSDDISVSVSRDHVSHGFMLDGLRIEVVEWSTGLLSLSVADDARDTYFDTLIQEPDRQRLVETINRSVELVQCSLGTPFRAITELSKAHHEKMVAKGFWDCQTCGGEWTGENGCFTCGGTGKHRDKVTSLMLIASEAFEAFEGLRKPSRGCDACKGTGWQYKDGQAGTSCEKCDATGKQLGGSNYAEEIADIVIRCLDEAGGRGIDLGEVIRLKMAYNDTRPRKHGKTF